MTSIRQTVMNQSNLARVEYGVPGAVVDRLATTLEELVARLFTRRWVCNVVRSGYNNGSHCTESDPHQGWDCGWRHEASLTDERFAELLARGSTAR